MNIALEDYLIIFLECLFHFLFIGGIYFPLIINRRRTHFANTFPDTKIGIM